MKTVAPPSDENKNYLAILNGQSLLIKGANRIKIDHKPRHTIYSNLKLCSPRMNSAPASERDNQKKKTYEHHIFEPTAGARGTIFPKHCMVIELVEAIKKGAIIF